jgi:hypothetical protein
VSGHPGPAWRFSPQVHQQLFDGKGQPDKAEVGDRDYVDYVRQFRRSELVAMVAAVAPAVSFNQADYQTNNTVTPWGLADIARVSLAFGSERNRISPTREHLVGCLVRHNNLGHRGLEKHEPDAVAHMMLQLAFSQFPHQRNVGPMTGRSIALLDQTEPAEPAAMEVLRGDWQQDLLGCSLVEFVGVTQLLMAAAAPNRGRFDPAWIEGDHLKDLTDIFNPDITRHVLRTHLVAGAHTFRTRDAATPSIDRRFTFSPLLNTPVVSGLSPDLLLPIPNFLAWKPTPSGLSYAGMAKWGEAFARDLGRLFEAYVGRLLHLIPGVDTYPEIVYRMPKKQRGKSVDWIVVFPGLVLLVEAKARRSTEALRSGGAGAAAALQQTFDKGNAQLDTTFDLIKAGAHEFAHIPADRPIVGIVVTLDDFHMANSALHLPMYSPAQRLPSLAVCADELEGIVGLGAATEAFLHEQTHTAPGLYANLRMALSKHTIPNNPVLAAGIDAGPIIRVKDLADSRSR